jgi:hypothetical protein
VFYTEFLGFKVAHQAGTAFASVARDDPRCGSAALLRLQAAEFLYETRLFPEVEYTFKHALTHEVTYGGPPGCPHT